MTSIQCLECGHHRIAFLAGRFAASGRSRLRYRGFAAALADARLRPPPAIELDFLDETPDPAVASLMQSDERSTALFCSNDVLALAVIGSLNRLGFRVPADVSVVGFDGISLGRMVEPPLITVELPTRRMGADACRHLVNWIGGQRGKPPRFLPYTLRQGGSLGAVSADPVTIVRQRSLVASQQKLEHGS